MINEHKRERFVTLAEKRVDRAIYDIGLIGNLSTRSNYSYEDADIKKIYYALQRSLREMKKRFDPENGVGTSKSFKL